MSSSVLISILNNLMTDSSDSPIEMQFTAFTSSVDWVMSMCISNHISHSLTHSKRKSFTSSQRSKSTPFLVLYTLKSIVFALFKLHSNLILVEGMAPNFSPLFFAITSVGVFTIGSIPPVLDGLNSNFTAICFSY